MSEDSPSVRRPLPSTDGAQKILFINSYWAAGAGLLPFPIVDFAAITAVNLKMLRELALYYGLEFRDEAAKSAVTALVTGATVPWLALGPVSSVVKLIPVIGHLLGVVSGSVVAAATTYAVGRVFILHFGAGGTFLDFDPEKFRDYFQQQLEEGRTVVRGNLK